jgi:hypothetical protein
MDQEVGIVKGSTSLKAWAIKGVAIIVILAIWSSLASFEPSPPGRDLYRPYDLNSERWLRDFGNEYAEAVNIHAEWVLDPTAVGLRVAGYPNVDQTTPDHVSIFHGSAITVTMIVADFNLMDDSIAAKEIRVELVKQGDIWAVAWAGWRQQCGRDLLLLSFGWTTSHCS